ncbi:ROK family glucokinase [Apilactobacillus apisilvae]|uniref:Glucokinase n=1 Tax=Apilactobacillus apisilvae TaxID=2923364 RepID=A0ABY4PIQ7_9LACO|nr:ROK family glucokinase [Apilactobacillus apisilvae]UQS85302.1 ROK family glucokinase [Apilactobacillus apisilvae]
MVRKLIGIDLGGTTTKLGFLTDSGEILDKWAITTDVSANGSHIVPNIIESITKKMENSDHKIDDFVGIGMGTPGSVDREAGTVIGAYNLNWKTTQKIKDQIEQALGLPFSIDNDANVASLGEYWQGAGSKDSDVVFVTLGTGVGGGVIINGELAHGINGGAGEIGHITVEPGGFMCTCGKRGCLEQYASATGVINVAKSLSTEFTGNSRLKEMINTGEEITSKIVFFLADNGDIFANQVVDRVCYFLGLALANVGNTLNPGNIVIGGGVSNAGNTLLQPTTKYFQENAFRPVRDSTKIRLAQLGNDAGVIGAASLALRNTQK